MPASFRGGVKFAKAVNDLNKKLKAGTVKVGFLEGAKYPDGKSVAEVAAHNEYGGTVKKGAEEGSYFRLPRPFFRRMIASKGPEWPKGIETQLKKNKYDVEKTLEVVGEAVAGQLRESIQKLVSPPLAPSTIARKGFSKPLIDTSHMINSVDKEVNMK